MKTNIVHRSKNFSINLMWFLVAKMQKTPKIAIFAKMSQSRTFGIKKSRCTGIKLNKEFHFLIKNNSIIEKKWSQRQSPQMNQFEEKSFLKNCGESPRWLLITFMFRIYISVTKIGIFYYYI